MRVLISQAGKHGSTVEIGQAIAKVLRVKGFEVDVVSAEKVEDPADYDAFIIGSALYVGTWLAPVTHMVEDYQETFRQKPTWIFSSGPLGSSKPKEPVRPDVVKQIMRTTGALEHRLFGGRLHSERLGWFERFIFRWVKAPEGDSREWDQIEQWARQIAAHLISLNNAELDKEE